MTKLWVQAALVCAAALLAVCGRVAWEAHHELELADKAQRDNRFVDAVTHNRRALGWYVPGFPHRGRAVAALQTLARDAEDRGDKSDALYAWRSLRGALFSTRSVFGQGGAALTVADANIVRLMTAAGTSSTYASASTAPRAATTGVVVVVLGFAVFVGSAIRLASSTSSQAQAEGRTTRWRWLTVAGLALFALGLFLV